MFWMCSHQQQLLKRKKPRAFTSGSCSRSLRDYTRPFNSHHRLSLFLTLEWMCHTRSRRRVRLGVSLWVLDFVPELKAAIDLPSSATKPGIKLHVTCTLFSVRLHVAHFRLLVETFCWLFVCSPQALFTGFYSCWSMLLFLFLMISCSLCTDHALFVLQK